MFSIFISTQESDYQDELDALKKESEIPMEDLLESLPKGMLDRITGHGETETDSETDIDAEERSSEESSGGESDGEQSVE